jgi:two-component system, OmpR family, phosphate regulon sensor histidine kinase PhoR
MSRRFIQVLIVVITITLVGLIYMQMLWIENATKIKEDHFDQLVRQSLDHVVHRMEVNETSILGARLDLNPLATIPPQLRQGSRFFSGPSQRSVDDSLFEYGISLDFSIDGSHMSTRFSTYQKDSLLYSHQERTPMSYSSKDKSDPLSHVLNSIQLQLRKKWDEEESRLMKDIIVSDIPIQERISREMLDVSLVQAFDERGIGLPFEFAVYDSRGIAVTATPRFDKEEANVTYQKYLFPNDLHPKANMVLVYFPKRPNFIMDSMGMVLPTVIFTLVMILSSILTMIIIVRQKRLDEIKMISSIT